MAYDNNQKFKLPPRKKTILNHRKISLFAPCPSAQGKFASLNWDLVENNPRINVYTNDPADMTDRNGNGRISANMDPGILFQMLKTMEAVIAHDGPTKAFIENKKFMFPGGQRSEKPMVESETIIGKDSEGVVYLSVQAYDKERPKIKFPLIGSDFHNFLKADRSPYSKAELSVMFASGYVTMLREIYGHMLVTEYVEPKPKENKGGNGGGGNRNGGGGGGYGGGRSGGNDAGAEDDIDF